MSPRPSLTLAALALAACSSTPEGPVEVDLGGDLVLATTNGVDASHGTWTLDDDGKVLALTDTAGHTDQEYNLAWTEVVRAADVDVTLRLQRIDGVEDQGGGPAWRISGPADYYLARWNPLEHNYRLYVVEDGFRHELKSATVYVEKDGWHELRVRMVGDEITCWLDGHEQLAVTDATHRGAGHVGLWTKADARTRFADLVVTPVVTGAE